MKTVRKKVYRGGFLLAHWKRKLIGVPIPFAPDEEGNKNYFEEMEVEKGSFFDRIDVIDLNQVSVEIIREICEKNDLPFTWITGLQPRKEGFELNFTRDDFIGKAISYFIALKLSGTTPGQYRKQFDKLIKEGVISLKDSVEEYQKKIGKIEDETLQISARSTNEQMLDMLHSFHKFLKDPSFVKKNKKLGKYKAVKKDDCLTDQEAEEFFGVLKKINPTYELFARVLRYLNSGFRCSPQGPVIGIEVLLGLKVDALQSGNGRTVIDFTERNSRAHVFFSVHVPENLFKRLKDLAEKSPLYVFSNKNGGPIDSGPIRRAFKRASKEANLGRKITPTLL